MFNRLQFLLLRLVLVAGLAFTLSACGQKGDLFHPEDDDGKKKTSAVTTPRINIAVPAVG